MRFIGVAGAVTDPQHMGGGVIVIARRAVDAGQALLVG